MISGIIETIYKSCSLFFLYAHLCASLSRFRIGLPVRDNVFKELKCYNLANLNPDFSQKEVTIHASPFRVFVLCGFSP